MSYIHVIPRKDHEFDVLQQNLLSKCNANKVAWHIPQATLDELNDLQSHWTGAWQVASKKNNRTATQVATKNVARKNYEPALRNLIQVYLYRNRHVTNDDIVACGVRLRDTIRTVAAVPETVPVLKPIAVAGNAIKMQIFRKEDKESLMRRGKPRGVARTEIAYSFKGEPTTADACEHRASVTVSNARINIEPAQRGQKMWYYARWVNTREQPGPWTNVAWVVM